MDRNKLGKIFRNSALALATKPLGIIREGPSKVDLRRLAEAAARSGVKIEKLPPVDHEVVKRKWK